MTVRQQTPWQSPVEIGSRREVFWDDFLVDSEATTATRRLHRPEWAGPALVHDAPWEGDGCGYGNILADDGVYRMYYLAWAMGRADPSTRPAFPEAKGIRVCYAESRDGIAWTKPSLGLRSFEGSTDNNIILDADSFGAKLDNFMVFKDGNPDCPPDARYKAVAKRKDDLWCLLSADGIRFRLGWRLVSREESGSTIHAFDSLNVAFWDPARNRYSLYFRGFHKGGENRLDGPEVRDIRFATSRDLRIWTKPEPLDFLGAEDYPLYTNAVAPYARAPQISIGFPSRYVQRRAWTPTYDRLPGAANRRWRMDHGEPRYGLAVTDCVFMFTRDGLRFHREDEAFMVPGPERPDNWVYGDCYPARGLVETPGRRGSDRELSFYAKDGHWSGNAAVLQRYCLRLDGFVSRHAAYAPQRLVTKPIVFAGDDLRLNFATSARGYIRVTLRDEAGRSATSHEIFGDSADRVVDFAEGGAGDFAGRPAVLEFEMSDADLYALRFAPRAAPARSCRQEDRDGL